ncbi:hypothetical protein ACSBR1_010456 [Camellia fascicularis]
MQKQSNSKPSKCLLGGSVLALLCSFVFITLLTIIIFTSNVSYPHFILNSPTNNSDFQPLHSETLEPKAILKFSDQVLTINISIDKLAETLSGLYNNAPNSRNETSNVEEDLSEPEESKVEEGSVPGKVFNSAALHSYISPKPNRINGKKNFLGLEAINPSIRLGCVGMALNTDRSPQHYNNPLPVKTSLWTQLRDVNILWNHDKCKDYTCLVSNETIDRRGFYKCYDCFDLSRQGWEVPTNESLLAESTIDEVLSLKPGEIHVGLDFSPTTGTFAAIMREKNVTVASTTLNLAAPFNEFVLFDWDRVLQPKDILWVDRFFCKKEDMNLYLNEFTELGYQKMQWRVVPKTNKDGDEMFFSAVLEKPTRR